MLPGLAENWGSRPGVELEEGIHRTAVWYREQGML